MAKKGGRNRMKRLAAPRQWDIERKEKRFVLKPDPGPHSLESCYPLGVVVRDLLGLTSSLRELKFVLSAGDVLVDGKPRRSPSFPVGLFNLIEVQKEQSSFRMLPSPDGLVTSKVNGEQGRLKLCRIESKVKIKGGQIQYGFHDGRAVIDAKLRLSPGDAVLMKVPEQTVVSSVKLAKGSLGLVISGERAGQLGKINDVKKGSLSRDRMVVISLPSGETELPSRLVFPVGTDRPAITVQVSMR